MPMFNFDQVLSKDRAREQFAHVIATLRNATKIIQSNRIKELIEVGPEEQKRRDEVRRAESLADFHRYWEQMGGTEGQRRAGGRG